MSNKITTLLQKKRAALVYFLNKVITASYPSNQHAQPQELRVHLYSKEESCFIFFFFFGLGDCG